MVPNELRAHVVKKQLEVDKWFKNMGKELKQEAAVSTNVELFDDKPISKQEWEAYYVYLEYMDDYMKRFEKIKTDNEVRLNKAFVYKLILRKAVGDSNKFYKLLNESFFNNICGKSNDKILNTLWDRMAVASIAPFGEFYFI